MDLKPKWTSAWMEKRSLVTASLNLPHHNHTGTTGPFLVNADVSFVTLKDPFVEKGQTHISLHPVRVTSL